eukprot:7945821-Pyramimonas_sp.AAC.1
MPEAGPPAGAGTPAADASDGSWQQVVTPVATVASPLRPDQQSWVQALNSHLTSADVSGLTDQLY